LARNLNISLYNQTNFIMKDFKKLYQTAKENANRLMAKGQITQYLIALKEMNQYKQKMLVISAN